VNEMKRFIAKETSLRRDGLILSRPQTFGKFFQCKDMRPFLRPEFLHWLLGQKSEIPTAFLQGIDAAVLAELHSQKLTPFLYYQLSRQGGEKYLAPEIYQRLKRSYYATLQHNLGQDQEALQVIRALTEAGVEVILLKGADLRLRVYDDPGVRPMGDLDLLIAPEAVPQGKAVLGGLGYSLSHWLCWPGGGFTERYRVALHFEPPPGSKLLVDLHWCLEAVGNFYRLPYSRLNQGAISWSYHGLPVKLLSPEHLLMHLCLHLYDELSCALQLVDLGLVCARLSIDWGRFLEEAMRCRCQLPLSVMLGDLARLYPGVAPAAVAARLRRHRPPAVERLLLRHHRHFLVRVLAPLRHLSRPRDRFAYLVGWLWPCRDELTQVMGKPDRRAFLSHSLVRWMGSLK